MIVAGVSLQNLGQLRTLLNEATRTDETNASQARARFVPLRPGTDEALRARQHQLLTGRRGTGKSTLLVVAREELRAEGVPVAVVDMEKYKNRPFPDVLIEILIALLDELRPSVEFGPDWWRRVQLHWRLRSLRRELGNLLKDPQTWSRSQSRERTSGRKVQAQVAVDAGAAAVPAVSDILNVGSQMSASGGLVSITRSAAQFEVEKIQELYRIASRLSQNMALLVECTSSRQAAVFVDDFYYVSREDQARVLDYLKIVVKGTGVWLKIGGVGEMMTPFQNSNPPVGMQLNQDIYPFPIDVTLNDFMTAQVFLENVMDGILKPLRIDCRDVFTDGARSRMVLACGGAVARDYVTLTNGALDVALERINKKELTSRDTELRITAEDVNKAANKRKGRKEDEELNWDAGSDATRLGARWRDICDFTREQGHAAFILVPQRDLDEEEWGGEIRKLENLRLIHRIGNTVPNSIRWQGKTCVVYMVDLGQLTEQRLRNGITEFWLGAREFDKLRRAQWVYRSDWRAIAPEGESPADQVSNADDRASEDTPSLFDADDE